MLNGRWPHGLSTWNRVLVGAFSVIKNLRMELFEALEHGDRREMCRGVQQQPATYLEAIMEEELWREMIMRRGKTSSCSCLFSRPWFAFSYFDVYRGNKMALSQNMNMTKSLRSIMFLVMKILMRLPASFYLLKSSHLLQFSPWITAQQRGNSEQAG